MNKGSPILIGAVVAVGKEEFTKLVSIGSMYLNSVKTGFYCTNRIISKRFYDLQDIIHGHIPRKIATNRASNSRGSNELHPGDCFDTLPSTVKYLHGYLRSFNMYGICKFLKPGIKSSLYIPSPYPKIFPFASP